MKIKGIIVPIITPFLDDRSIDFVSLKKQVNYLYKNKIDGLLVCGTTGEGHLLTLNEKIEILEFIGRLTKNFSKDFVLIAATATTNLEESRILCLLAEELKYDAILSLIPKDHTTLVDFYSNLKISTSLPIFTYHIPILDSIITPQELSNLIDKKFVVGVKDSSQDKELLGKWKKVNSKAIVALGGDKLIAFSLLNNCVDFVIPGTANAHPKEVVNTLNESTIELQNELNKKIDIILTKNERLSGLQNFVTSVKQIQKEKGIIATTTTRI